MGGRSEIETDYLVIGAGALGMGFVDTLIEHSDADCRRSAARPRRPLAGFLPLCPAAPALHELRGELHPLGQDRVEPEGRDAGFFERASGRNLRLLRRDHASPILGIGSGAVLPDVRLPWRSAILVPLTGARDGSDGPKEPRRCHLHGLRVPAADPPPFEVADGATCVPIGALTRVASPPMAT